MKRLWWVPFVLLSCAMPYGSQEIPYMEFGSVEEAALWVADWVEYKADDKSEFQLPQETYGLRTGDCEDFAILLAHMLEMNEFSGVRVEVGLDWELRTGHAWVSVEGVHWGAVAGARNHYLPGDFSDMRRTWTYKQAIRRAKLI